MLVGFNAEKLVIDQLTDQYGQQELLVSKQVAKIFVTEVGSLTSQLSLMGQIPEVAAAKNPACQSKLQQLFIAAQSQIGNLGRVGADGNFACSLNTALVGIKADTLGPYIDAIFSDPSHAPVMSRAILPKGSTSYIAAIHVPIFTSDGKFDGTLGGAIYFNQLQDKFLKDISFSKNGFVSLYDDDGTVLYRREGDIIGKNINSPEFQEEVGAAAPFQKMIDDAKAGQSGIISYTLANGDHRLAAYAPAEVLPGRTWVAVVSVSLADIHATVAGSGFVRLMQEAFLALVMLIILAAASFYWMVNVTIFVPMKKIDEMKSDFVSLVSHQLKTPSAQIKGYAANMIDGLTGPLTDKQREYLGDMISVANRNSKLIDDLLNVSRIERGLLKVELVAVSVDEVMRIALSPVRLVASQKGVTLVEKNEAAEFKIRADVAKTPEALRNIIDNAVKFTPQGGTVEVTAKEWGSFVQFSIKDAGPGIDPDVQKELFEKNRVWSGKVKASGAGLGLYLSKRFIELGGGTIAVVTGDKGTTFTVQLPKI
jgi:signal transduction histidine kinase